MADKKTSEKSSTAKTLVLNMVCLSSVMRQCTSTSCSSENAKFNAVHEKPNIISLVSLRLEDELIAIRNKPDLYPTSAERPKAGWNPTKSFPRWEHSETRG